MERSVPCGSWRGEGRRGRRRKGEEEEGGKGKGRERGNKERREKAWWNRKEEERVDKNQEIGEVKETEEEVWRNHNS